MSDSDNADDWRIKWRNARKKSVPYFVLGFGLILLAIFTFASVLFEPPGAFLPWWYSIPIAIISAPFLAYGFILAKRAFDMIPDPDFEDNSEKS